MNYQADGTYVHIHLCPTEVDMCSKMPSEGVSGILYRIDAFPPHIRRVLLVLQIMRGDLGDDVVFKTDEATWAY